MTWSAPTGPPWIAALRSVLPQVPPVWQVYDLATSGLDLQNDVIVEVAVLLVVTAPHPPSCYLTSFGVNWEGSPEAPADLEERLAKTAQQLLHADPPVHYPYTLAYMRDQPPADQLPRYLYAFLSSQTGPLVGHGTTNFDWPVLQSHLETTPPNRLQIDTSALIASENGTVPWTGQQSYAEWQAAASKQRGPGRERNLEACTQRFGLELQLMQRYPAHMLQAARQSAPIRNVLLTNLLFENLLAQAGIRPHA